MMSGISNLRLIGAALATALYLLLLVATVWRVRRETRRREREAAELAMSVGDSASWLVVYASQTGTAEELARRTANALHTVGLSAQLISIEQLDAATLTHTTRALFVASTTGEGDPPDGGALFMRRLMNAPRALGGLQYGVLALGDRDYRNFCAFGRTLDEWLHTQGATRLFTRVEASNTDPAALSQWRTHLMDITGTDELPEWLPPRFDEWQLVQRELLNPGSAGAPMYDLRLAPADHSARPDWQAGDLAQITPPGDESRPRDFSIASLPSEGHLRLLVRVAQRDDGSQGLCSGWLCTQLALGDAVPLRVRSNRSFRQGDNAPRPWILIGNGTGIAGLRAHLQARAQQSDTRNWLLFGERNAAYDAVLDAELQVWEQNGVLTRLDRVYSRDPPRRVYVQDRLRECAVELRQWVDEGAAIYVCGSLDGMGSGVAAVLEEVLGTHTLAELLANGRYRRDVY